MTIINPATEEVIAELKVYESADIENSFQLLNTHKHKWADTPLEQRVASIKKFGVLSLEHIDDLALTLTREMGKPLIQAKNEIRGALGRIEYFTEQAEQWLKDEHPVPEGDTTEMISYEPLGVIANISAWNYPYNVGYNVFIPALIAGNAVMYKPSEHASLSGLKICDLLYEAGIPDYAFQCIIGNADAGQKLLDLPLDGYFFTGSYKTGKYIAGQVASKLVPLQLELGGKDALYVCDDVKDIKNVAAAAADGAFYNNGQSCCAVERIYVHESIADEFIKHFVKEVKGFQIGSPEDDNVYIGPLTRKEQIDFLKSQINDAIEKGASLMTGGKEMDRKGYYMEPTVLSNVNHDMTLMKEESFGPLIGIQLVKDDHEAIQMINDCEYGLTNAVFSTDKDRAESIFRKLNSGTVYWNCCDRVSPYLPWSGRKNSGLGSTLSYQGLRAFLQPKSYHIRKP